MPEIMPMIPGLMGGEDFPGEETGDTDASQEGAYQQVVSALNGADPLDIEDMVYEADDALASGTLDALMSSEPPAEELTETPDDELSDVGAPAPDELDASTTATMVAATVSEIASLQSQLEALVSAEGESEADVDVDGALEIIVEALDEATTAQADAEGAANDEDLDVANEALAIAEGALEKAREAYDSIMQEAKDAAGELEPPGEPDPLILWAQNQG